LAVILKIVVTICGGGKDFNFHHHDQISSGAQPTAIHQVSVALEADHSPTFEGVIKSFWTGRLEQELQMVKLSATSCCCIAIL